MKKTLRTLLALCAVVTLCMPFAACKKDDGPVPITALEITDVPEAAIEVGSTYTLSLKTTPEVDLRDYPIVWESSDTSVATVSNKGRVTPVDFGTATITVKVNETDVSDSCVITVVNPLKFQLGNTVVNLTGGAKQEDGKAKIEIPSGANDWGNSASFTPTGNDFVITAKLNFKGTKDHLQAGIMLHQDGYSGIKLVRAHTGGKNVIQFSGCSGAAGELVGNKNVSDDVNASTLYLRLVKKGEWVSAFYSEDGTAFTYVSHGTTNITVNKIHLFGSTWTTETGTAVFEDLQVKYTDIALNVPNFAEKMITFTVKNTLDEPIADAEIAAAQGAVKLAVDDTNKATGVYVVTYFVGMYDINVAISSRNLAPYEYTLAIDKQDVDPIAESVVLKGKASLSGFTNLFVEPAAGAVADEKLTISTPAVRKDGQNHLNASLKKSLTGTEWTVSICIDAKFNNANQFAGIVLASSNAPTVNNVFGLRNDWGGHVGVWSGLDINSGNGILTADGNAKEHKSSSIYIRIKRIDTAIQVFTSDDGKTYTKLADLVLKDDYKNEALDLFLYAGTWEVNFTTPVVFSDYDEVIVSKDS